MAARALNRAVRPLKAAVYHAIRTYRLVGFTSTKWVKTSDGFWMMLDPNQFIDREIVAAGGTWEPALRSIIKAAVKPGEVCIDVGAHKGYVSCLLAQAVGATGRVLAFEPDPRAFEALTINRDRNGFEQIEVFPVALGDKTGHIDLSLTQTLGNTSSFPNYLAAAEVIGIIKVKSKTLDSILNESLSHGKQITFIKIDAEGAESLIFDGMQDALTQHSPLIAMEINFESLKAGGFDLGAIKHQLINAGYSNHFELVYKEVVPGVGFTKLRPIDITQERGLLIDTLLTRDDNSRLRIESFFA
ncbi:FkbM family methyltransferase [Mesorhizobium sp.]|uniref:FkbM family methyltransferase n=1 Tax=Mesorhizobium sp. TaxID=1871066 RepID=UPI0011F7B9B9|nr:FkbM family methyltransferase [Mesorhizobium sp.]TIL40160.1 MAG: FkbM family methyltransferase [Mesorhizobium sp.]